MENHLTCRFWVIEGLELRAATIRDIEEKKLGGWFITIITTKQRGFFLGAWTVTEKRLTLAG